MPDKETNPTETKESQRRPIPVDTLLFIFLLVGWLLIFLFATLGLYRGNQDWLPINPVVRAAANYSVDAQDALRLAQVRPEIIDAVKQDEKNREALKTPTPLTDLLDITPTTTVLASITPTVQSPLTVNVGGPYQGEEGSEISLVADNFNSVLGIIPGGVSYVWDLDGDGLYDDADGPTAGVTFLDEGDYPISVKAIDLIGRTAIDTTVANVLNVDPLVQIGENIYTSEGRTVPFAATASDPGRDVLFYQWDFGDGTIGVNNTLRPQHIFEDDGEYLITLRVRDNDGGESKDTLIAYVGNLPPDVDAGPDQVVDEGSPLTLKGDASDPGINDKLSYAWDLDYNGNDFSPDIEGEEITTTYIDGPDNVVAALGVKDEDGGETIDTVNITVNNVPPLITSVSNNGPVGEGTFLNITVSATDVGNDTLTYAFDWNNDGNYETIQQPNSASNIWYNQGQYRVGIRVDDGDGGEVFSSTVVSTFNLTPTAIAQIPKQAYFEGSTVPFNGSESSDPGINDTLTYAWNFGDGSTGSGVNPTHTYVDNRPDHGVYSATLTVTDDSGAVDRDSLGVLILNANPKANAGPDRTILENEDEPNITVSGNVNDPGGNEIISVEWDFDYDGVTFEKQREGETVTYTYPNLDGPEEKIVALRVRDKDYPAPTDKGGEIGEFIDTFKLTVKNVPPVLDEEGGAGGPYKGIVSEPITITARTADDVDGDTLTYEWDLDYDGNFNRDATGQTIIHTWDSPGLYDIALRVVDDDGDQSSVAETTVNVNAIPIANAGGPYSGLEGSRILFDGSGSIDPDGDDLTYTWNFGDGTATQANITTTHIFTDNGTYTTTLILRDSDGDSSTDVVTATIFNANPVIAPLANQTVAEGKPLSLVSSVSDPGAGDTLTYAWDFDYDGVTVNEDSTQKNPTKTYANGPATYTVALRVRDDDYPYQNPDGGQIGQALRTFQVTVNNVAPIAEAGGPYYNVEGQPITLTGTGQDVAGDTLNYAWDLDGDGTIETPGRVVNNTWAVGGNYTVTLQVTDSDGGVGTDIANVEIDFIPTAVTGGPYSGSEGVPITVDGSGSFDPDDTTLNYTWDFGDGKPAVSGAVATHVYLDNGDYTATLTVDDGRGGVDAAQTTITISNTPPNAVIGGPYSGNEEEIITFNASGSTDISPEDTLSFAWNFGDGTPEVTGGPIVTHAFGDNGTYNVVLRVTDDDGGTNSANANAVINNLNPTAEAGGPYRTTTDVAVTLTGSGSDVPADTLTYAWDLDNNGTFETPGQTINNTWTTPGLKTIALGVTDDDGGFATDTATVDVGSPPVAKPGGPYTANENSSITLDGSASSDPDNDPLSYTWNFGDGSPTATGATVNHTYVDNGSYIARLTVNDGRGGVATAQANVTINNVAPTANIGGPYSGNEGQNINFDGSGSSDPGPNDTLTYSWNFGDGATGSGATVSHQYNDNGTFNVTLTVTDKDGAFDNTSTTVNIANVPPTANAGGPYSGDEGSTITFDGSGSNDPNPADTLTYRWDFGDGSPVVNGPVASHTYNDNGNYTVRLTVTDDDGGANTDTINVPMANVPPTANAGGPYSTTVDTPVTLSGSGSDIPADPLSFDWDLDNNGDFETSGQSVDFTQSTTGTYTVRLRVSDDDGGSTTASTTVQVNSLLPLAWLSLPYILTRQRRRNNRKKN